MSTPIVAPTPVPTDVFGLRRLLNANRQTVEELSCLNCHVRGMHSIVLSKRANGSLFRLYVAEPQSDLHLNYGEVLRSFIPVPTYRLGVHAHHCELSLRVIKGEALHWIYEPTQAPKLTAGVDILGAYQYNSKLRGEQPGFTYVRNARLQCVDFRILKASAANRACIDLPAEAMHTMAIDYQQNYVAWLVEEGAEDHEYEPLTYSLIDLEKFDFTGLYQKASFEDYVALLEKAQLI
jgi:hypothetical protein